jgi:hypothetical protein
MDLEQKQKEDARWRILRILDSGRPVGVNEDVIARVLHDVKLPLTMQGLRRELAYLRDSGLITIEGEDTEVWAGKLTPHGIDIVEYTAAAPAGIARPKKYW